MFHAKTKKYVAARATVQPSAYLLPECGDLVLDGEVPFGHLEDQLDVVTLLPRYLLPH